MLSTKKDKTTQFISPVEQEAKLCVPLSPSVPWSYSITLLNKNSEPNLSAWTAGNLTGPGFQYPRLTSNRAHSLYFFYPAFLMLSVR